MWLNIHLYIYTHKQNQNSPTKIKYNRLTQQRKPKITSTVTKLTKAQTGKQNEGKVPIEEQSNENETNKYVEGGRKKRKNRYTKLNRGR